MAIDYTKRSSSEAPRGVSLSKVTLTKAAPRLSLEKSPSGGVLRANLNWSAQPATAPSRGFLKRLTGGPSSIDLDLGCLWELTTGEKGVVQALGNSFKVIGTNAARPVIELDGDDRSGAANAGENLLIDLGQAAQIKRVLVFAYIYEGVPNWAAADAVVTMHQPSGPQIEVALDEPDAEARFCVVALLQNSGSGLSVQREMRYIKGSQRAVDEAYGWGLQWQAGRK